MLACLLTWPLIAHVATRVPDTSPGARFDALYSAWVLSWQSHALVTRGASLADANIYYPTPKALFYGPLGRGALPLFAPAFLLTENPALALNLLFLLSIALAAATLHLVVWTWTRSHAAGLVAAFTLLANRWLLRTFVSGVPHLCVLFYFPLVIFLAAKPVLGRWSAVALVAFAFLQCTTDVVYMTPAVLLPLTVLAVRFGVQRTARRRGERLLAVVAIAAALVAASYAGLLAALRTNPAIHQQTNWVVSHEASPPAPKGLNDGAPRRQRANAVANLLSSLLSERSPLGVPSAVLLLILCGAASVLVRGEQVVGEERSAWRHAAFWLAMGLVISLPPKFEWWGEVYTSPVRALGKWYPVLDFMRDSARVRVPALFGLALLAGLAFAELLQRMGLRDRRDVRKRFASAALAALMSGAMYAQYALALGQPRAYGGPLPPYRLRELPRSDSSVLKALRSADGPVVEVPVFASYPTFPAVHALAMYHSIFHWQPLLNGYSSYWPARFPRRMEIAARLPEPRAVRALQELTGLSYILVRIGANPVVALSPPAEQKPWLSLAKEGGRADLELVAADGEFLLFRLREGTSEPGVSGKTR